MAAEIFVFAAAGTDARAHYERTILSPVPVEEIARHDPGIAAELSAAKHDSIRCWGSIPGPGNLRNWTRMQPGHWAMLYAGEGRFPYLLRVAYKARSRALAEHLWGGNPEGRTWELTYFFDEVREASLGIDDVRASLGYNEDWWPQGLQYPTPDHQAALLAKFGSLAAFVELASDGEQPIEVDEPEAGALLLGGPFKGAPSTPPKQRQSRPSDPDVAGRGYLAHEETVAGLAKHVGAGFRKGTPGINHDGGWPHDGSGAFSICEVKSINSRNEVGQLQKGLGQVLHNRFKAERHGIEVAAAYLIAEKEPANSELWQAVAAEHGVVFSWPERFELDVDTGGPA